MFTLTFIDKAGKLHSVSSPKKDAIIRLFRITRLSGIAARVWDNSPGRANSAGPALVF